MKKAELVEQMKKSAWTWYGVKKASISADIDYPLLRKALLDRGYSVLGKLGYSVTELGEATGWMRTCNFKGSPETFISINIVSSGFKAFVEETRAASGVEALVTV
jgi:hypothetical protein